MTHSAKASVSSAYLPAHDSEAPRRDLLAQQIILRTESVFIEATQLVKSLLVEQHEHSPMRLRTGRGGYALLDGSGDCNHWLRDLRVSNCDLPRRVTCSRLNESAVTEVKKATFPIRCPGHVLTDAYGRVERNLMPPAIADGKQFDEMGVPNSNCELGAVWRDIPTT